MEARFKPRPPRPRRSHGAHRGVRRCVTPWRGGIVCVPLYASAHAALTHPLPPPLSCAAPELERWGLTPPKTIPQGVPAPLLPFGEGSGLEGGSRADYIALLTAAFPLAIIGYMGAVTITKTVARCVLTRPVHATSRASGRAGVARCDARPTCHSPPPPPPLPSLPSAGKTGRTRQTRRRRFGGRWRATQRAPWGRACPSRAPFHALL